MIDRGGRIEDRIRQSSKSFLRRTNIQLRHDYKELLDLATDVVTAGNFESERECIRKMGKHLSDIGKI